MANTSETLLHEGIPVLRMNNPDRLSIDSDSFLGCCLTTVIFGILICHLLSSYFLCVHRFHYRLDVKMFIYGSALRQFSYRAVYQTWIRHRFCETSLFPFGDVSNRCPFCCTPLICPEINWVYVPQISWPDWTHHVTCIWILQVEPALLCASDSR